MSSAVNRKALKSLAQEFAVTSGHEAGIVTELLDCLSGSVAQRVKEDFVSQKHAALLDIDIDPSAYEKSQVLEFRDDYQAISLLSKYSGLTTGLDKRGRAMQKFLQMEEQCKRTNFRFRSYRELENSPYALWIFSMRRKIDLILGEFKIEKLYDNAAWGPGVTTLIKGDDTSATRKFQSETGITQSAYALFGSSLGAAYPNWFREERVSDSSVLIQEGNTVTFVPKNSKIDRVIAVEPGLNLWLQRGVGVCIRDQLRRRGIDLSDQSRNQQLSKEGSITGLLSTVDFSSASDSIAKNLVEMLFPGDWVTVLTALRCQRGKIGTETFLWEKFSSMGNGFTFELESLIFFAAALVACEQTGSDASSVSVFGDDVIIPTIAYDSFVKFSEFLGFTVNLEKSFSTGYFRESCGAHWFDGLDVKPIFLKKTLSNANSVYHLVNSIRRLAHRRNNYCGCDYKLLPAWRRVLCRIPGALRRLRIPEGYGDVGVASNFDEATPDRSKNGHDSYEVVSVQCRNVSQTQDCIGLLNERLNSIIGSDSRLRPYRLSSVASGSYLGVTDVGALRGLATALGKLETISYGNETSLRDRTVIAVKQMTVHTWYNFGAWT